MSLVSTLAASTLVMGSVAARSAMEQGTGTGATGGAAAVPVSPFADDRPVHIDLAATRTPVSVSRSLVRTTVVAPFAFATVAYNKWYAKSLLASHGWNSTTQYVCLVRLWTRESHWNEKAHNHRSGAHGIPQALPGRKMAKYGTAWRTDPRVQIKWGMHYIDRRYGSPCRAWRSYSRRGWY